MATYTAAATAGTAPALVTTAPTAPTPTTTARTTAAIYHGVPALRPTYDFDTGAPDYEEWDPSRQAGYGTYGPEDAYQQGGQYGSYIQSQMERQTGPIDVGQYIGQVDGRSQWDWQREQIQGQFDAEQQRQIEQLDAYLAAQGITGGAAVQARNDLMRDLSLQRAQAMNQVSQQEAGYLGQAAMAEAARRSSTEQALLENAFSSELGFANLNQRERQLAENARQFDNRMDFDAWATEQGFTENERQRAWQALQNDENRRLTAGELQFKIDDMRNRLAYDYEQLRTATGIERERILYDIWSTQQDIASAERRLEYGAWADRQLSVLNTNLEMGVWTDQAEIQQRQQAYFNMGKAGVEIPDEDLQALASQDPLAYYAYLDGRSGLSQAVFDANLDMRDTWLRASITALSDLDGQAFINAMGNVYRTMDQLFGPSGEFGGTGQFTEGAPTGWGTGGPAMPYEINPNVPSTGGGPAPIGGGTNQTTVWPNLNVGQPISYGGPAETTSPSEPGEDVGIGYEAPTGTVTISTGGMPARYAHNVDPETGEGTGNFIPVSGSARLYRGTAGEGTVYYNTMDAPYDINSYQGSQIVRDMYIRDPRGTARMTYDFDDETLRAAAQTVTNNIPNLQPITPSVDRNSLEAGDLRRMPWDMLHAAGRTLYENGVTVTRNHDWTFQGRDYMPVDWQYMNQLAAQGDLESLLTYTNQDENGGGGYINIGGHPYICVQSYDAEGNPLPGIEAWSVADPTHRIYWNAAPEAQNRVT